MSLLFSHNIRNGTGLSILNQSSMSRKEIEIDVGGTNLPVDNSSMISFRLIHRASSNSLSFSWMLVNPSASAVYPSINELENGHGCEE